MTDTVVYEQHDAVALISMNRPDSLNGFTSELCTDLLHAFEKATLDDGIRAVEVIVRQLADAIAQTKATTAAKK